MKAYNLTEALSAFCFLSGDSSMNPIQRLAGQYLYWTQPPLFDMEYILQDAEQVQTLATLKWQSSFALRASITIGEQLFNIDRVGFLNTRIEIRKGTDKDGELIATFKQGWTYNGTLTFENGRKFEWKNANIWSSHWKWMTPDEGELMKFTPETKISRMTRSESKIEMYPPSADFPDVELLAVIGWYMMLVMNMDAASAS
jgi:hypothetical protein